jgi:hypothetical protein
MGLFDWPITKKCDQTLGTPKMDILYFSLLDHLYIGYKSRPWGKEYEISVMLFGTQWEHQSPKNPIQPPKGEKKLGLWCMLPQLVGEGIFTPNSPFSA